MATRRQFLLVSVFGAFVPCAFAQSRQVRIGMLSARPLNESFYASGIVRRLGELGYREGSAMKLEFRAASGGIELYPKLARELAGLKCDLLLAVGPEHTARHFRDVAPGTPLVFLAVDYDPVEKGIVTNLRQPGGNATGVYVPQATLAAKRVQIMSEIVPGLRRMLIFVDPFNASQLGPVTKAAEGAGVSLKIIEFAKPPYDFEAAFGEGLKAKVEAYIELASPVFASNARLLSSLLQKYRLPGAAASGGYVEAGVLVSYGPDATKTARRAADVAARVLKGAKAGDIPVEQVDEFELVINARTAANLGVKIPERVLARATKIVS